MLEAVGLHVPSSVGVWPEITGSATPLASLVVHVAAPVSQNSLLAQSESCVQPGAASLVKWRLALPAPLTAAVTSKAPTLPLALTSTETWPELSLVAGEPT